MSQLPFFTWHNILCAAVVGAVGAACGAQRIFYACRFSLALRHTELSSVHVVALHNNMLYARQHGVRSARLPCFGEMFHWRKSSVFCFSACGAVNGASGTVNYTRAAVAAVFCARDANRWQHYILFIFFVK
jgi:hypothetical protein